MTAASLIGASSGCAAHQDVTLAPVSSAAAAAGPSREDLRSSPAAGCTEATAVGTWNLERRAAQLVVVPAEEDAVLAAHPLAAEGAGGIILFGSQAPSDLPANLAALQRAAAGGPPLLVMADEEGGKVQRLANLVGNLPWPRTMAATITPAQTRALAEQTGRRMRAIGVTMDLAPVLDLSDSSGPDAVHPDGPRSFSIDAPVATAYGLAFAQGLEEGGVIPVVKHFPGLGQATSNSDDGPAYVPPLSALKAGALRPFEAAIKSGVPAVMVANAAIPGLTGAVPASLSAAAISGLLRHELGFRGLVLTDTLSALAVQDAGYSVPQAAARAVEAGADMVLFTSPDPEVTANDVIASIVSAAASGQLPTARLDDAVNHVLQIKNVSLCH
jgi:beta-N-acetylhexosaminidase